MADTNRGIGYEAIDHSKLRQLTREQLVTLEGGDVRYVRLWRAYEPTPLLIFEGKLSLWVHRLERKGKLQLVTLSAPGDCNWAEYTVYHSDPTAWVDSDERGNLIVEDWCMEVYGEDGKGEPWKERGDETALDYLRWDRESLREIGYQDALGDYTQLHPRAKYVNHRLTI